MEEAKKVDLDLSAPSIQLVYEIATITKSEVLPRLLSELERADCKLDFAEGTKQVATFIKQGQWLVEIHPEYVEGKPILDFGNSEEFYKYCCRKKSRMHIVRDEFSEKRAQKLYPLLSDLEGHFRVFVVKIGFDLTEYQSRNRGKGVHLVSWLETSELFGSLLLNKASEEHYLKQVKQATTDDEFKDARGLTIADEFGYGGYKLFFAGLPELRNKVMHGRIITQQEYEQATKDIRDLRRHIAAGRMAQAFGGYADQLRPLFQQLAETAQIATKLINQVIWSAGGIGEQLAAAQKATQGIGAMLAASKPHADAMAAAMKAISVTVPKVYIPPIKPIFPIEPPEKDEKKLQ